MFATKYIVLNEICKVNAKNEKHKEKSEEIVMKKREHLPFMGVGPLIISFQVAVTAMGIVLSSMGWLSFSQFEALDIPLKVVGTMLIFFGVYLYFCAAFKSKLFNNIAENKLVTTGVYSIVRNPIYSAFLLFCTGAVCMANNVVLFIAPVLGWAFMTVVLKMTEEKWLKALYGEEYVLYCKRVNRSIPWFSKKM